MNLPKLALDSLPDLTDAPGLVGSLSDLANAAADDRIIYLMVYLYDTYPPDTLLGF